MKTNEMAEYDSTDMNYGSGMVPPKSSMHGTAGGGGKSGGGGESHSASGPASVRTGLSMRSVFHGVSNEETGHCTAGRNQVPIHPKKSLDGGFTCY